MNRKEIPPVLREVRRQLVLLLENPEEGLVSGTGGKYKVHSLRLVTLPRIVVEVELE